MQTDTEHPKLWHIPTVTVQLADGATLIKPGKAILQASPAETERMTGVSTYQLRQLADEGYIRRGNPTPGKVYYYPAEVTALKSYIEAHPDFWSNPQTRQTYLNSKPQ